MIKLTGVNFDDLPDDGGMQWCRECGEYGGNHAEDCSDAPPWICIQCGSECRASRSACWKCGRHKPED